MTAFEAKDAGTLAEENMRKMAIDWVTFEGRRIPYRSVAKGEHYRLIVEAMRAKRNRIPRCAKSCWPPELWYCGPTTPPSPESRPNGGTTRFGWEFAKRCRGARGAREWGGMESRGRVVLGLCELPGRPDVGMALHVPSPPHMTLAVVRELQ
jgi:hypothetical protein